MSRFIAVVEIELEAVDVAHDERWKGAERDYGRRKMDSMGQRLGSGGIDWSGGTRDGGKGVGRVLACRRRPTGCRR